MCKIPQMNVERRRGSQEPHTIALSELSLSKSPKDLTVRESHPDYQNNPLSTRGQEKISASNEDKHMGDAEIEI